MESQPQAGSSLATIVVTISQPPIERELCYDVAATPCGAARCQTHTPMALLERAGAPHPVLTSPAIRSGPICGRLACSYPLLDRVNRQ